MSSSLVDQGTGALFIGTVFSSILYGVTWLQVYSYYSSHCSRDRWPLKFFVAFLMLVESANVAFVCHTTYCGITSCEEPIQLMSWSIPVLSSAVIEVSVQHFYAYRIYILSRGSPYLPAAISVLSLAGFVIEVVFSAKILGYIDLSNPFEVPDISFFIAELSCNVLCDVLITFGMVYILLRNRTQVRRTNNVLNLLAIYSINCGTLNLVFAMTCIALYASPDRDSPISAPPIFIMIRLYFCAFMAILNSRDNLRETLDGGGVVSTFSFLKARTATTALGGVQVTTESSINADVPKSLPLVKLSSIRSFPDLVTPFDNEQHPIPPVTGGLNCLSA